jgi:hypothetical protein
MLQDLRAQKRIETPRFQWHIGQITSHLRYPGYIVIDVRMILGNVLTMGKERSVPTVPSSNI